MFLMLLLAAETAKAAQLNRIKFEIDYKEAKKSDTLVVILENILYNDPDNKHHSVFKQAMGVDGKFHFDIVSTKTSGYISVGKLSKEEKSRDIKLLLWHYFFERGDDIAMSISYPYKDNIAKSIILFSGNGDAKYIARRKLIDELDTSDLPIRAYINNKDCNVVLPDKNTLDSLFHSVDNLRKEMSRESWQTLKLDRSAPNISTKAVDNALSLNKQDSCKNYLRNSLMQKLDYKHYFGLSADSIYSSALFLTSYINAILVQELLANQIINPKKVIDRILEEPNSVLRDRAICYYLIREKANDEIENTFTTLQKVIQDPQSVVALRDLKRRYSKAIIADYSFTDIHGNRVTMEDLRGKVVLIDLWFYGCGGCAYYYGNVLSKVEDMFKEDKNIVFLSINTDKKKEMWLKALDSGIYTSKDIALNVFTNGNGASHPIIRDLNIPSMPCVILVNKIGNIEYFNTANLYDVKMLPGLIKGLLEN